MAFELKDASMRRSSPRWTSASQVGAERAVPKEAPRTTARAAIDAALLPQRVGAARSRRVTHSVHRASDAIARLRSFLFAAPARRCCTGLSHSPSMVGRAVRLLFHGQFNHPNHEEAGCQTITKPNHFTRFASLAGCEEHEQRHRSRSPALGVILAAGQAASAPDQRGVYRQVNAAFAE